MVTESGLIAEPSYVHAPFRSSTVAYQPVDLILPEVGVRMAHLPKELQQGRLQTPSFET